ncbi:hypothetical protein [Cellulomonas marina]|uniref:Uncharacterized protein n=1 Tax=Cellulomonas marina TaxID=988821 RepID=A0A1I0W0I2_9CELL|nr:hypothetical protein [Cellulomonas marina]GIG27439.1 hypothetical protein Cma02nite_00390 [Cellulomonas marina]SFA81837.1 hypothetical protein SAMN05421867_10275 [Cellulomonas marina]
MVARPQWEWHLHDAEGRLLERPVSPIFTTQYDAEVWLGEHWRALSEQGVVDARLVHEGRQASPTVQLPSLA